MHALADAIDTFTIPAEVDALTWARAILGSLRPVAPDYQRAAAALIVECAWEYEGETVRPLGPTLDQLRGMLAEHEEAVIAEAEDIGPPHSWPAWTDSRVMTLELSR